MPHNEVMLLLVCITSLYSHRVFERILICFWRDWIIEVSFEIIMPLSRKPILVHPVVSKLSKWARITRMWNLLLLNLVNDITFCLRLSVANICSSKRLHIVFIRVLDGIFFKALLIMECRVGANVVRESLTSMRHPLCDCHVHLLGVIISICVHRVLHSLVWWMNIYVVMLPIQLHLRIVVTVEKLLSILVWSSTGCS